MEKIQAILGMLSLLAAGAAVGKLILYYKSFNLPVIDYLESSEIFVLFADNLISVVCFALLLVLPYQFVVEENLSHFMHSGSILEWFAQFFRNFQWLHLYAIGGVVLVALLSFRKRIHLFEIASYLVLVAFTLYIVPVVYVWLWCFSQNASWGAEFKQISSLPYAVSVIAMLAVALGNEIRKVKHHGYYANTIVVLADSYLIGNENEFYVGKTKGFVFVYDKKHKACTAYQAKEIKAIRHKR